MRLGFFVLAVVTTVTAPAFAQDHERARELFLQCRAAEDGHDYEVMCTLCAESYAAVPSQAAASALSRCEEAQGQLAKALSHEQNGLKLLRPDDANYEVRAATAKQRIVDLEARVPRIAITWPADDAVELKLDGRQVARSESELLVDAGAHELSVSAPGREPKRETVTLVESQRLAYRVEPGAKIAPKVVEIEGSDGQLIAAYIVGGVGLLGLAGFGVTGGLILDRKSTVEELCDPDRRTCPAEGADAATEGRILNVVNLVSLAVGVAGLGTGLVLLLTADDGGPEEVSVGLASAYPGVEMRGSF